MSKLIALSLLLVSWAFNTQTNAQTINSEDYSLKVDVIADGLNHPWALEWLNDALLISERSGDLILLKNGKQYTITLPVTVFRRGQGGVLDIKKHPNYQQNNWLYLTYSAVNDNNEATTSLARFRLNDEWQINDWQTLFQAKPWRSGTRHFGSRIAFDDKGFVYVTVGDRGERDFAQIKISDLGKVIRLKDDGSLPSDNPFSDNPAVFSLGHRNAQGLVWFNGELFLHEHGPFGGDEFNRVEKGKNYGWPTISHGKEYSSGLAVSETTHKVGMEAPLYHWIPSIAPSGLAVYEGDKLPKWRGDFLLGSLKFGLLVRLKIDDEYQIIKEERLINGNLGRIRAVYVHSGDIYLLSDSRYGKLIKISSR